MTNYVESRKPAKDVARKPHRDVASDFLSGPATFTYSETHSSSVDATWNYEMQGEAGIVIAKASAKWGVALGKSWAKTQTWTYTFSIPAGKTQRVRMFHVTRKFHVRKYKLKPKPNSTVCIVKNIYSGNVHAPLKENVNVWLRENY